MKRPQIIKSTLFLCFISIAGGCTPTIKAVEKDITANYAIVQVECRTSLSIAGRIITQDRFLLNRETGKLTHIGGYSSHYTGNPLAKITEPASTMLPLIP